jgi:hypothetical protein
VSEPAAPGPRLVYDADAPERSIGTATAGSAQQPRRKPWLALLLVAAALLAGFQWHRANGLAQQVGALTAELATARGEIAARSRHLDAIRGAVEDVRERMAGLASLAAEEPTAASVPPSDAAPAH